MHSQPGPGFYKDHTSQAKPDHSEQVEGCVCLGGGQAVFPNILFSPPDGLERNYYVSDNQPITDIESTSGEGGAVSKPFNAHFFVSGHFSDI